ncbi:MAG: alpha/beta fold hydrolase [Chitinophagaceae bacterium]|nr:MAG: alpha/beta fold hydrolase [Chitinophagaceae bacterium]
MRILLLFCVSIVSSLAAFGQDVTGQWAGALEVQGARLRLIINVKRTSEGFSATLDSPDQGAKGILLTSTQFSGDTLKFALLSARIEYEGKLENETIKGTFKQNGQALPLTFLHGSPDKLNPLRPQEPQKPYPYNSEDVTFKNDVQGITLAGTLTTPKGSGSFPAVVLISGSGPQNRDEELLGHKPFLVLADFLTKSGIAVLRYDDRGTGLSKGNFGKANSLDFATDVEAAITYLKSRPEINKDKIGLIGHSEGGLIAPIVATRSKDISFVIMLAGPGLPGDSILLLQQQLIGKASGIPDSSLQQMIEMNRGAFAIVRRSKNDDQLKAQLTSYIKSSMETVGRQILPEGMTEDEYIALQVMQLNSPWMKFFLQYDPAAALTKIKCPVLALNGEKDLQVPPKENILAIKNAVRKAGNSSVTTKIYPSLNHLFQECTTGAPDEYSKIEQTMSPMVLNDMLNWIKTRTK